MKHENILTAILKHFKRFNWDSFHLPHNVFLNYIFPKGGENELFSVSIRGGKRAFGKHTTFLIIKVFKDGIKCTKYLSYSTMEKF